ERMRGVRRVVLDPHVPQPKRLGQPVDPDQRGQAGRQLAARWPHGQEVAVAPQRVRPGLDAPAQLGGIGALPGCVGDLERPEALLAHVPRVERVVGLTFLAAKRLWRHICENLRRGLWLEVLKPPYPHLPGLCGWSLMELAPFPYGRLPGLRRAMSLHPSGCVQLCSRASIPILPPD